MCLATTEISGVIIVSLLVPWAPLCLQISPSNSAQLAWHLGSSLTSPRCLQAQRFHKVVFHLPTLPAGAALLWGCPTDSYAPTSVLWCCYACRARLTSMLQQLPCLLAGVAIICCRAACRPTTTLIQMPAEPHLLPSWSNPPCLLARVLLSSKNP